MVHLSLVVVSHLGSPVLYRHNRLRLHPLQALKNITVLRSQNEVS